MNNKEVESLYRDINNTCNAVVVEAIRDFFYEDVLTHESKHAISRRIKGILESIKANVDVEIQNFIGGPKIKEDEDNFSDVVDSVFDESTYQEEQNNTYPDHLIDEMIKDIQGIE